MNILIVSQNITIGGAQRVIVYLAHYMKKLGHNVIVFSPHVDLEGLINVARDIEYISPNVPIMRKVNSRYEMLNKPLLLVKNLWKLRRELKRTIKEYKIDVINAHNPPSQWISSFLSVPVVWSCNEPIALWQSKKVDYFTLNNDPPDIFKRLLEQGYELFDYIIARWGVHRIVVLDHKNEGRVKRLYKRDAYICRPGADLSFFSEDINADIQKKFNLGRSFVLLQTGHFNPEKNQQCSIKALSIFQNQTGQSAKLMLVGDGPLRKELEDLAKGLNLHDSVIFAGRVDDSTLRNFYHACNCLLFPAVNQTWGLTTFEAIAAGKVPIVSDDCGASEVIAEQEIGFVANPNPEEFARMIEYVSRHPEECKEKVERGQRYIGRELTYRRYAQRMLQIFRKVLDSQKKNRDCP